MTATPPLKIGCVGAGRIARVHARALRQLGGTEFVAWSAGRLENASAAAGEFGGKAMTTAELLHQQEIEVVVISSPTPRHADQMIAAMEKGKHVFCEKPMARSEEQAREMIAAAEQSPRVFFVAHSLRFVTAYAQARELVRSGTLGTLRRAVCRRLNMPPAKAPSWFYDTDQSGGVILDLIIHDFDFLNWCLGTPKRVEVETSPDKDSSGMHHAIVHLYFSNNVRGEVEGSWQHPRYEQSFLLEGDQGRLYWHSTSSVLQLEDNRGTHEVPLASVDPYLAQMQHFLHHLRTGAPLLVTPQDAQEALAVSLTALKRLAR